MGALVMGGGGLSVPFFYTPHLVSWYGMVPPVVPTNEFY